MKVTNIMNFVRRIDERMENSTERLLDMTAAQLKLVNEYGLDNTFLLQYDAVCDEDFVALFKNEATEKTELGLWYEIVEPLTSACSMPYRSDRGWKWDWHIIPGFSMAYTPEERELLIDEAMRKFKETFGYYPKTVASWLIDTHTLNHLSENYDVSAVAICRDQHNVDAYTLLGGYFNQAYYPSKNNMFTPAQSKEAQMNMPIFRLLGSCPIHNYDKKKYASDALKEIWKSSNTFTLEPVSVIGSTPEMIKWMFDCYYSEESLGFAYSQIGQENSFLRRKEQLLAGTRMQIDQLLERGDVRFLKMCETGEAFKERYPNGTPATSVIALNNFDADADIQSVYYDCKNYSANLFRFEDKIFLRSLFLFDERREEYYLKETCTEFYAVYENLPIVDTLGCSVEERKQCGLMIETEGKIFDAEKLGEGELKISFGEDHVIFCEDRIEIKAKKLMLYSNSVTANASASESDISFEYKGSSYRLCIDGASISTVQGGIEIAPAERSALLTFIRE
ncbi:MAG: hypothetical protein J6Q77_01795 [Clostridia bacterium]|nr:hypothetical protein [Clostridia bacterium]